MTKNGADGLEKNHTLGWPSFSAAERSFPRYRTCAYSSGVSGFRFARGSPCFSERTASSDNSEITDTSRQKDPRGSQCSFRAKLNGLLRLYS